MWIDFRSSSTNVTSTMVEDSSGFQLSLVSVTDDMRHLIDTVTNTYNEYNDNNMKHQINKINNRHSNMADQQLVRHIIKLLSAKVCVKNGCENRISPSNRNFRSCSIPKDEEILFPKYVVVKQFSCGCSNSAYFRLEMTKL